MTLCGVATLTCDCRRWPGCEWSYDLGPGRAPAAVAARRRAAAGLGWKRLPAADSPTGVARQAPLDLCPLRNAARLEGDDLAPRRSPPPLPRTIGEAAGDARDTAALPVRS
jgi:hypothetical protein